MGIAGSEFRPGITNANDGFASKLVIRDALVFHPGTVNEAIFPFFPKPALAT
jgi:hypothetical protein